MYIYRERERERDRLLLRTSYCHVFLAILFACVGGLPDLVARPASSIVCCVFIDIMIIIIIVIISITIVTTIIVVRNRIVCSVCVCVVHDMLFVCFVWPPGRLFISTLFLLFRF